MTPDRPQNYKRFLPKDWGNGYTNVWLGVTVEDHAYGFPRVDLLRDTPAKIKFLSCEPLLEDISDIDLNGIDWVIVGGESGPGARPFDLAWARSLRQRCDESGVSFFFKQLGSKAMVKDVRLLPVHKTSEGKSDPHGKAAANFPDDLKVQQWPSVDPNSNLTQITKAQQRSILPEAVLGDEHVGAEPPSAHVDELIKTMSWLDSLRRVEGSLGYVAAAAYASLEAMLSSLNESIAT